MLLTCPECAKKLKVAESAAGKKIRCPQCKATVTAPKADEDAVAEAIEVAHAPTQKRAWDSDEGPAPKKIATKAKRKARQDNDDEDAPAGAMRCAKCESPRIEALPPNRFARRPGFLCKKCGARMRPPASQGFYLFAILLGVFGVMLGFVVPVLAFFAESFPMRAVGGAVIMAMVGVAVIGWSFQQMRLPVPLNAPPFRWGRWLVITFVILVVGALVVGGCLFGFAYFLHEML
jgi:phage FluMu protein Com